MITLFCGFSLKAAEIGKEYTNIDEDGTYTITIVDELKVNLHAVSSEGDEVDLTCTYEDYEENVIAVYIGSQLFTYAKLNEDGTWEEYEIIEQPIIYPCQVVIKDTNYGELKVDVLEGEIGEIVTITPKAYTFCVLNSISVNGVELLPNEEGLYQFALVEGENILQSSFSINEEDMELIAGLINDAKKGNWEDIFTIDRMFDIISWVITILFSTGFLVTLVKLKNVKAKTSDDVVTVTNNTVEKAVEKTVEKLIAPLLQEFLSRSISTEEISKVLARCMTLAQENTPEARLAIIAELTKLQTSDADLAIQVKNVIAREVENSKKVHEQKLQAIEELKKSNEELKIEKEDNSEGRI